MSGRCPWAKTDAEIAYHDSEWGVPERNDARLFEMLTLEGAQAGLSWSTILNKREGYRRAYAGFDVERVAAMGAGEVERLVLDASIVRHRGKIESVLTNARAARRVQREAGSFASYVWGFVGGEPVVNAPRTAGDIPAQTPLSREISRDLKKRGFVFVGPTTVYAFMQAAGLVNDHLVSCPRRAAVMRANGPGAG